MAGGIKRLKQGRTLGAIIEYLIEGHPQGRKRSELQESLIRDLGVGESTGGVNRQLKRLRQTGLIGWNQETYTYTLPADFDTKDYFVRVADTLDMNTDQAFFLLTKIRGIISPKTALEVDDHIGFRYDREMSENIMTLQEGYKAAELMIHELIGRLVKHHNSYVRMRLFKTANECFIKDLAQIEDGKEARRLLRAYAGNLMSAEKHAAQEAENMLRLREELIGHLNGKRLSNRMKFLIRYTLNNVRPSHVYDGLI
ncbi:MAG: hypothetical protein V1875_04650 [Candidatus Altiarchaeota archaeon]